MSAPGTSTIADRDATFEHRHRPDLDGIRGLLALTVLLLHYGINQFLSPMVGGDWPGFAFGFSVDVFFLLSGFVLASSYLASPHRSFARFAIKRFFRLAPVFYVTTLLVLPFAPTNYRWDMLVVEAVMGAPFFSGMPANFPAWSITWEFYLPLAAFLAAPWLTLPRAFAMPLLLACIAGLALIEVQLATGTRIYLMRAALGLAGGALLYRIYAEAAPTPSAPTIRYALFAALMTVMAVAKSLPPVAALAPPLAAALIWTAAGSPSRLFASYPLQWLGVLSYTLYMAHIPVLQMMKAAFGERVVNDPLAMLAAMGLSFALAAALTRLVELPGIRLGGAVIRAVGSRREPSEA